MALILSASTWQAFDFSLDSYSSSAYRFASSWAGVGLAAGSSDFSGCSAYSSLGSASSDYRLASSWV